MRRLDRARERAHATREEPARRLADARSVEGDRLDAGARERLLERVPHLDIAADAHDEQQRRPLAADGGADTKPVDIDEADLLASRFLSRAQPRPQPRTPAMSSVESTPMAPARAGLDDHRVARAVLEHAMRDVGQALVRIGEEHLARRDVARGPARDGVGVAQDVLVGDHGPRPAVDLPFVLDGFEQHDDRVHMLARHPLRDGHQQGLGLAGEHARAHCVGNARVLEARGEVAAGGLCGVHDCNGSPFVVRVLFLPAQGGCLRARRVPVARPTRPIACPRWRGVGIDGLGFLPANGPGFRARRAPWRFASVVGFVVRRV